MQAFCQLTQQLDSTTRTLEKVAALTHYFRQADPADAAWAIYFLTGQKLKRLVPQQRLRAWAGDKAGIPSWLFEECYEVVGDLAETIALLLPPPSQPSTRSLTAWVEQTIEPLRSQTEDQQRETIERAWEELGAHERFVLGKLLTGGFRIGVSQQLVIRALADVAGTDAAEIAHRLMGQWRPSPEFYQALLDPSAGAERALSQPYPFLLAHPFAGDLRELGSVDSWQIEWKWDGIRAQVIRRADLTLIWSRGEEMIGERFPEVVQAAEQLPPGTVLDGELLAWRDDSESPRPFSELQRRIGRKQVSVKLQSEIPVKFLAFDLLEIDGRDVRSWPLSQRQTSLDQLLTSAADARLLRSPLLPLNHWSEAERWRTEARQRGAEGLMIKDRTAEYPPGRPRGVWWKWKLAPYTVDAVLIYAQAGHGRRANLYTDFTFAVWQDDLLVPIAKAYSGLTDQELAEVDRFIRSHTKEKFGPVRSVEAELVFEIAFENIQRSTRHKSGVAVRFPRIVRWRRDKSPADADTLGTLLSLLSTGEANGSAQAVEE